MFKNMIRKIKFIDIVIDVDMIEVFIPLKIESTGQYISDVRRNDRRLPVGHRWRGDVGMA